MPAGVTIKHKRKTSNFVAGELAAGELGLNTSTGVWFFSVDGSTVASLTSVPSGVIVMWGGLVANIPSGWLLCDGQNGTPDLRSRFIKGASGEPGGTGGSASHVHTYSDIVNHTHPVSVNDPGHAHNQRHFPTATGGSTGQTVDTSMSGTQTNSGLQTASGSTGITATTSNPASGTAQGTTDSGSNEPPYFALAFIQKV